MIEKPIAYDGHSVRAAVRGREIKGLDEYNRSISNYRCYMMMRQVL